MNNNQSFEDFFNEAKKKSRPIKRKKTWVRVLSFLVFYPLIILGIAAVSIIPLFIALASSLPVIDAGIRTWEDIPSELDEIRIAEINTLYDVNGDVFAKVWSENRIELDSLDEISDNAINALIATEDKRFYEHSGIDILGTARALLTRSGGGSGITQQTIKNLRFYNQAGEEGEKEEAVEHSLSRKVEELKLSLAYEESHSKDEILLTYFNTVAMGTPNIYGIESASNFFFGKSAKDLTLNEATILVGTVQNPVYYDMRTDDGMYNAKVRQKDVLYRMVDEGLITQSERDEVEKEKLEFTMKSNFNGNCTASSNPNYCNYVMDTLRKSPKLGDTDEEREAIISKGGLEIYTYYDPKKTEIVQNILDKDFGRDNRIVSPVAVVEPGTGGVNVIAVNRGYGEDENNTTLNIPNLPTGTGSTFKMMTLAAALNEGYTEGALKFYSECPLYPGSSYDFPSGGFVNSVSCSLQGGLMDYQRATAVSSNTWFVTLEKMIGVLTVKDFASSVGLGAPDDITERSLSYTLGSVENTPIDMAAAFATFANEGVFCPATPIKEYQYEDGSKPRIPDNYDPNETACKRVMSPYAASIVLKAMRAATSKNIYPDAFNEFNYIEGDLAVGKSGTNELFNSAWAQVSSNASLFINIYDNVNLNNQVEYVRFRGEIVDWVYNAAARSGGDIMRALIAYDPPKPLNFNNKDTNTYQVPIELNDFFIVPSVIGMEPQNALDIMDSLNLKSYVSKDTVRAEGKIPPGVVVEQSIPAGTRLAKGTTKEMILKISSDY